MRRYKHSLSHYQLLTAKMGNLYPIANFEVLPGDTVQHSTSVLVRAAPLVAPVMHPVRVRIHHFFVPYRILWTSWEDFITGGQDGLDASSIPTVAVPNPATDGPLLDYLGVPPVVGQTVNALPVRAYNKIINDWYIDKDLGGSGTGLVDEDGLGLRRILWERDYLTSARPWPQKGASVTLPLGTSAPVNAPASGSGVVSVYDDAAAGYNKLRSLDATSGGDVFGVTGGAVGTALYTDLTSAASADIIAFREAMALQRYEEARARYGSRYVELLAQAYGVSPQDSRLDRAQYIGGGKQTISFSEVLYTAEGASNPVGYMRGHGIAAVRSRPYRVFIPEHGIIMSCLSARPKTLYSEGVHRKWLRTVKEDYFQPELQDVGMQEVLDQEVFADATAPVAWGYQDRYAEYKSEPSKVTGDFRSTLDYWHLGREFGSLPTLNAAFVQCTPRTDIFADTSSDNLYIMAAHSIVARRVVNRRSIGRIR